MSYSDAAVSHAITELNLTTFMLTIARVTLWNGNQSWQYQNGT